MRQQLAAQGPAVAPLTMPTTPRAPATAQAAAACATASGHAAPSALGTTTCSPRLHDASAMCAATRCSSAHSSAARAQRWSWSLHGASPASTLLPALCGATRSPAMRTFGQLAATTAVATSFTGGFRGLSLFQNAAPQHTAAPDQRSATPLSPASMRTPERTARPLPSTFLSPVMATGAPFETPRHATARTALSEALTGEGSHVWAPHRGTPDMYRARFDDIRRFSESSSDEGSPMSGAETSPCARGVFPQRRALGVLSASDDGTDSSGGNLVCNLAERFNNAQLYDSINDTP